MILLVGAGVVVPRRWSPDGVFPHQSVSLYNGLAERCSVPLFGVCPTMQDIAQDKATYPKLLGMEGAKKEAQR